jgi:hypothetical protein
MDEQSIFAGVVRGENAHTQLLCNLMEGSKLFRKLVYSFLTGAELPPTDIILEPQYRKEDGGIPDITVSTGGVEKKFMFHLEVKVSPTCPMTSRQNDGYSDNDIFLVPRNWDSLRKNPKKRIRYWSDLSVELGKCEELLQDSVFLHYEMLLGVQFSAVHLKESETEMLTHVDPKEFVSSACKLQFSIKAAAGRLNRDEVNGNILSTRIECGPSEYGFYIKEDGADLLWVGMWGSPGMLLCAAYMNSWRDHGRWKGFTHLPGSSWSILSMNELVLGAERDLVQALVSAVKSLLAEVLS